MALAISCPQSLKKLADLVGKLDAGMCPLAEYWNAPRRNTDRARRRLPHSDSFRAHSAADPRPSEADAPLDEPPANEDDPEWPHHGGRFGGIVAGQFPW